MNHGMIQQNKPAAKSAAAAFWMSLFFTGLGQVYNGELLRGIVLYLLIIISFLYLVISASLELLNTYFFAFIFVSFIILFLKIYSIIDAVTSVKKNKSLNFIAPYRKFVYIFYALITTLFLSYIVFISAHYYKFVVVTDNLMEPSIHSGDICLTVLHDSKNIQTGDIILAGNSLSRVISDKPSVFEIKMGRVWVNGEMIEIDVPENKNNPQSSSLLYNEIYEKVSFNIHLDLGNAANQSLYQKLTCLENELITLNDNRLKLNSAKISSERIFRMEGVFISSDFNNLLKTRFAVKKD